MCMCAPSRLREFPKADRNAAADLLELGVCALFMVLVLVPRPLLPHWREPCRLPVETEEPTETAEPETTFPILHHGYNAA